MKRVSSAAIASVFGPRPRRVGPIYRELCEIVREQVLLGHFSPGQRMPSTRILAADLGVSRNTVLNAFDQLKAEGYLQGSTGSGTYVARILPEDLTRARKPALPKKPARANSRPFSTFGSRIIKMDWTGARTNFLVRPFQPGIPAVDAFPFDVWSRISNRRWKAQPSG